MAIKWQGAVGLFTCGFFAAANMFGSACATNLTGNTAGPKAATAWVMHAIEAAATLTLRAVEPWTNAPIIISD